MLCFFSLSASYVLAQESTAEIHSGWFAPCRWTCSHTLTSVSCWCCLNVTPPRWSREVMNLNNEDSEVCACSASVYLWGRGELFLVVLWQCFVECCLWTTGDGEIQFDFVCQNCSSLGFWVRFYCKSVCWARPSDGLLQMQKLRPPLLRNQNYQHVPLSNLE